MFSIFIKFDPATAARIDRLLNYLEGQQQAEVDALTRRLKAARSPLAAIITSSSQK